MNTPQYFLKMRFLEESYPDLLDISSLLYDLELSHDYGVLLSEKKYLDYEFSRYFWYRNGRPIDAYYRVKAGRIVKESPLELTLIIASIGALWVLLQIIEKVVNWPLNRKKLKLEVEKLEHEAAERGPIDFTNIIALVEEQRKLREGAATVEDKLVQRLAESRLALIEIEVGPTRQEPNNDKDKKG
jgi:hypothetical protein